MKTPTNGPGVKSRNATRRKVLIGLAVLIALATGFFLFQDIPARLSYNATYHEVEKVAQGVLVQPGAVQRPGEEKRGDGIIDTIFKCWPDVGCPTVTRSWLVPIQAGKESEFLQSLLRTEGYTLKGQGLNGCAYEDTCSVSGQRGTFMISVSVEPLGNRATPPSQDVSPKRWRLVDVRVNYR